MGGRGSNSPSSSNGNIHTERFFHAGHFRNLAALVWYRVYGMGYMGETGYRVSIYSFLEMWAYKRKG